MKVENRALSFIIIAIVYILAAGAGIGIYIALNTHLPFWLNLLIADVAATVVTFAFSLIFRNASVYDPYWSVMPIVILGAYAIFMPTSTALIPLITVLFWGIRLTANWAYTFKGLTHQDWRYSMLKERTGKGYFFVNFTGIHLVPTLVVYGCILPVVFIFVYEPDFNAGLAVFCALSLCAVALQGIADCTMHKFRKEGTGGFIRRGVWKYSRHPNYLGEIAMWWGIALAAVCVMPDKWWLISGAIANTLLFLFISIPLAEGRQSKKEGWTEYKKNTRMLFPIYKKQK